MVVPFTTCNKLDFANVENKQILDTIEYRLCPDKAKLKDIWKLKGAEYQKNDKISFQLQIGKCTRARNYECQVTAVDSVLNNMYFTLHHLVGKA